MEEAKLTMLQRLDLYQIISYAKQGKTEQVIDRAQQMLSEKESLVTLTDDQWADLAEMTIGDILGPALYYLRESKAAMATNQPTAEQPAA